jgi:hypothetical protein
MIMFFSVFGFCLGFLTGFLRCSLGFDFGEFRNQGSRVVFVFRFR